MGRRLVDEGARASWFGGWGENVIGEVSGEGAERWVGVGFGIECGGEALVQACDGLAYGFDGSLCGVFGAVGVLALELVDGFEVAEGFGFFGF